MKILIDVNHPAEVHLFHNFAKIMVNKGHIILFTTRKKECSIDLLKKYKLNFISLGNHQKKVFKKILYMFKFDYKLFRIAKRFNPDLFLSMRSVYAAQVAFLTNKHHIALEDTNQVREQQILCFPFSKVIITPSCLKGNFGKKQIRINSYHALAYLHPKYFSPNPTILKELGIKKDEKYTLIRFVAWNASHDLNQKGLSLNDKKQLVTELSKYSRVFISSEDPLPKEFKKYQINISPEKMLDVLAFASLLVGESSTMASECACLGTPSMFINTRELDYCTEQEEKYNLVFNFRTSKGVIKKAVELINQDNKKVFEKRKKHLISTKVDLTAFLIWFIENYPKSANLTKKRFKIEI